MIRNRLPRRGACLGWIRLNLAACLLGTVASFGTAAGADDRTDGPVLPVRGISAHRGASTTHPENTLAAFHEAIRLGAQQIELDVCLTKDKQMVIMHDSTVDRTTDGTGKIADLTLAEIKRLDAGGWKGAQFAGERVPTLEEALAIMPVNIWLNLHLKGGAEVGAAVARQIVRDRRTHQAFVAAGRAAAEGAREVCPEILVCNMDRQSSNSDYVDDTVARGDDFIQLLGKPAAPDDMTKLKTAKVRINLCCTNDPEALKGLYAAGVDFVLTDDLATVVRAAERLGIRPVEPVFRDGSAISMFPVAAEPEIKPADIRRILFLGNSITLHGPKPDIGWDGNWGMAARSEDKDYVHLVTAALAQHTGAQPEIMVKNIAGFERNYATYDVDREMKDFFAFDPDLVVLAIGENVPALSSEEAKTQFQAAVTGILRCALAKRQPLVVVRSGFWPNAAKDEVLRQACQEAGGIFVDAGPIGRDPANAARSERSFSHDGVAAHPGDRGMKAIAEVLVEAVLNARPEAQDGRRN